MQNKDPKVRHINNPKLETVKPGYKGNKIINNQFANGDELYIPDFSNVLRWKLSANPQKAEKKADTFTPPLIQNNNFLHTSEDMIVWLGHATFFIRLQGKTLLTDPVFYDLPMLKRRVGLPCAPEEFKNIDYLLLSHAHRDHLDTDSILTICRNNPEVKALTPLNAGSLIRSASRRLPYQEAGWYQRYDITPDHLEIFFVPASHWHRRGLFDMNKVLWGGFVIRTKEQTLYFAGDTGFNGHFEEIAEVFGPMDICIMPVGAYKPSFLMQKSHLNPHEAVRAYNLLRGGTFIPMHYGTFDLSDEPASEPVRLLEQIASAGLVSGLKIPAIGEPVLLRDLS
ncbi:MBL fold metallo-hydrolase [Pontibacter sp. KCTC 32443]|uniref:MBL fold metallo-hydrolase n=1 Tax=Pontibacter TaxID=323449 RepID=UPI00164D60AD|nr:MULTISPECIES: MBL fold metallo-hydrolase [Pontibacter]MBC5773820.1 MBL fold metallo-hydrolase [Pontibacter sp. KCTC 32443]